MRRNLQPHEGRAARPWCLALAVLVTAAGLCLGGGTAKAQDVKSYTRATFDQWLTEYKDAKPDFKVGDVLTSKFLPTHITRHVSDQSPAAVPALEMDLATTLRNVERQLILDALERSDGVQRKAAKLLGVTERVLWYKIKKLQIDVGNGPAPEGIEDADVEEELN